MYVVNSAAPPGYLDEAAPQRHVSRRRTGYAGDMTDSAEAARIRAVLDMFEFGQLMYRTKLRRENPDALDAEIEAMVNTWRTARPGAPMGDAVGVPSKRFG